MHIEIRLSDDTDVIVLSINCWDLPFIRYKILSKELKDTFQKSETIKGKSLQI
jgi:ribosomal protein S12